jgi:hypothetical protein
MSGESYLLKNTLIKLSIKAKKKQQNKELWRNRKTEGRKTMKLGMTEKQKDIRTMKLGITERQKDRKELWITYHNSTESFFERIKGHCHSN